jgi:GT2 family glycosyltransferase/glycosyltransferase involved in cell wall biosynthesis/SAM-dependent methyltransferase
LRQGIRRNAALARRSLALAFKPQLAGAQSSGTVAWGVETVGHDEALGVWLAAAVRDGERLLMDGKRVGLIVADRERPLGMHPAGGDVQPLEGPSSGCAFRATGPDPRFELPWPSGADGGRFLVLEMRARTDDGEGYAQLYWRERADDSFAEERSMRFSLLADGAMRVSIIDLRPAIDAGRWPKSIASVRFDPLDRAGEFEVAALALLDARPSRAVEARAMIARRFLRGDGIEIGALQNPLQLPPQARVRYVDRLPLAELRRHYPELAGQELVDSSILASADRLTVVPEGTQDFVVCNHVLEHMRDPIGALLEWLRVLKPGGHLYVSIPDHQNPHDRLRKLTSLEHILADHRLRVQRAEEDWAHFFDWAHSAHAADMGPEQRESHARDLIAQDYSIHFHVFDRRLFEEVLGHVGGRAGSDVVELQENWLGEYREYIAIVRKTVRVEARARRPVDVVIPVYNARELTGRCLESVLRHAPADARVVVIDDASTTEGVAKDLQAFARRDQRVVVLSNPQNQGFVKTANRGLKNAGGRDVLLLNSDTEVFEGFLDQLRDAAYTDERTGIVTPFSNNATIYSIPEFARDNEIPEGHSAASVAELVAAVSRKQRPQMPTAVGFCMFIRAEVLERVGFFDEETFGRGFGEENDLCQRARQAGFSVRLCDDAFVWHKGKASFGEGGKGLSDKNEALLRAKHPEYAALIADFCERNPLAPLHREIRFHLERLRPEARAAALFVVHADPFDPAAGGTEHHVRDLVTALALPRALIAYPRGSELVVAEVLGGKAEAPTFFRFPVAQPAERFCIEHAEVEGIFRNWLLAFGVAWAHLHHLMYWPIVLGRVLRDAEVPYLFTAHDYYAVCPSWNLYDFEAKAVCECSWEGNSCSAGCIPAMLLGIGAESSADGALLRRRHRESFLDMLSGARAVVFPSEAARRATLQRLPLQGVRTEVVAHGYEAAAVPTAPRDLGGKLRLAVLGEISYQHKGAEAVLHLIELTRALPVEWHFLGDTGVLGYEQRLQALGFGERLHLHGRYRREEAAAKLGSLGADLCILLAQWDETFSYTLSEAAIAGVPAMVSDRGALGERVRRDELGLVVKDAGEAAQRIAAFCEDPSQLEDLRARVRRFRHPDMADNARTYRALYDGIGLPALSSLSPPLRPELLHELSLRSGIASAPSDSVSHGGTTASPPAGPRFPLLQSLKRIVPRTMWQLARDALAAIERPALLRLNPARKGHGARLVGLRLLRNGLLGAIYEASGDDPQILFAPRPFAAAAVKEVRFKLRRDDTRSAYAQLFWCHPQDKGFSESKSARIALNTNAGEWGEYRLRLDDPNLRAKWEQGLEIVRLRFDPMNVPGRIEVGPLVLCS